MEQESPIETSARAPEKRWTDGELLELSRSLGGEISLTELVDKVMTVALEVTGGERCLLLVSRGSGVRIVGETTSTPGRTSVRPLGQVPTEADLPLSILEHVLRTKERVLLQGDFAGSTFAADPYLKQTLARAVLCIPLVTQTVLVGALYLETRAVAGFTPVQAGTVAELASMAAVSVANAVVCTDLRQAEVFMAKAQELSRTGSFGWCMSTGEIFWSAETYRIHGFEPGTPLSKDLIHSRIHPDDRVKAELNLDRYTDEDHWTTEYRIVLPDGSIKHVRVAAHGTSVGATGELNFLGAIVDVTDATNARQALERALDEIRTLKDQLQEENVALREEIDKTSMFEEIVGGSASLRGVLAHVAKVAPTDSTVLITGETGTGKELVARAIHKRSPRAAAPFVSVNCAAIPTALIASELFGHERGAFTGASERRTGRFELAEGGTLFLDEVGELSAEIQAALLRVLQEHEFERVGGSKPIRTNVRLIAATNRDMQAAVAERTFRADLFYRLNVFPLEVPPLRERPTDIRLLVEYFIDRFSKRAGKRIEGIAKRSLDLLVAYAWPGNIRELQNLIERAVILADTGTLSIDERWLSREPARQSTRPERTPSPSPSPSRPTTLGEHEKLAIEATLAETKGRVSGPFGAAIKLGIPASTLESKIKAFDIDKRRFKTTAGGSQT